MNIVFVNSTKSWGGIKTWMLELGTFLAQRGHQVALVCRRKDALIEECEKRRLPCVPLHFGLDFSPATIAWFYHFFHTQQTEAVVTNVSKDLCTAGVAARLSGIVHINRLGIVRDLKNTLKDRLLYTLLVDRVFVPSQSLYDHFSRYEFLQSKLRWFHNALVPPPFSLPQNPVVKFAIVAKLTPRKQVDKILQVFHRLQDCSWELHIGGFGPEMEALQTLTRKLHLEQRVFFAGQVNPYEFLPDKDVGLLYSTDEGLSYALVEYMGMCCAVIASHVGGTPELVEHGVSGLLVDPYRLDDLEQAIRLLIQDSQQREILARNGYERGCSQFNQQTIFAQIEAEIRRTIAEKIPGDNSHKSADLQVLPEL
ncbi:glycosyltransferase [Candidatus Vecturithrix granuli]|uniref:Glycosyltransferase n=1 Tax=Vecturithrix granuli TaxID=1499967 RepID=A0A081C6D6_VECG1|nr:glycosyltransferase [Candidatus Vecturithrix granuli]